MEGLGWGVRAISDYVQGSLTQKMPWVKVELAWELMMQLSGEKSVLVKRPVAGVGWIRKDHRKWGQRGKPLDSFEQRSDPV